jgi:hypothetical protein
MPGLLELEPKLAEVDLGSLRNGLGSVHNLESLLKSLKVGPKALLPVVVAVHADCAPLLAATQGLAPALKSLGIDEHCADELSQYMSTRVADLEVALRQVLGARNLPVSERLRLEGETRRIGQELEAALPLVELLDQVTQPGSTRMTLSQLISQYRPEDQPASRAQRHVVATLAPVSAAPEGAVLVNPKTTMMLISLAVSLVCEGATDLPVHITLGVMEGGIPTTSIAQNRGSGELVKISTVQPVPPILRCTGEAARAIGAGFDYCPRSRLVRIAWGAAAAGSASALARGATPTPA